MAKKLYPETDIQNIANAIRALNGSSDTYTVGQMASAIVLPENAYYLKESASANPLSITDGEELKCQSTVVTFTPVQSGSGDQSPENVRPISGWDGLVLTKTGVNQWDEKWELGYYNINTGESAISYLQIRCKNKIKVVPNTNYYIKSPITMWILEYDSDDNYLGISTSELNQVFTTSANTQYIRFYVIKSYGTTYNNDISINYPSTDTEYHAYTGETHTATFDSTIYGGSYDFVSGRGNEVWWFKEFGGTEEGWSVRDEGTNRQRFLLTIDNILNTPENAISNYLVRTEGNFGVFGEFNIYIGQQTSNSTLVVKDENNTFTDLSDFKTYLSTHTLQIACPLKTSTLITLTPEDIELLKGSNTVWTDGDTVQLEYWSKSNTTPLLNMLSMNTINISNINNENNENEVEEIPIEESEESLEEIENIDNSENE